jgi:hypothetical protein
VRAANVDANVTRATAIVHREAFDAARDAENPKPFFAFANRCIGNPEMIVQYAGFCAL